MAEIELKKISEYVWEIEKHGDMNVPVRIFASESLLQKMKQDETLHQGRNVASLPSIYKYAIILPDGHQGYGFPIGGVAAFDAENGIISPGGIGFDINCIPPDTKILTREGFRIEVSKLPHILKYELRIYNDIERHNDFARPLFISQRPSDKFLYRIETEGGRVIKVTGNHPIYTKQGWKLAKDLKEGDYVLVYPFEGVEYEEPMDKTIIENIDADIQIKNRLKKLNLLPLKLNNPKIGILARVLGYLIGDGCIVRIISHGRERIITCFYGSKEGLEELRKDIEKLGFKPSRIYKRSRKITIRTPWNKGGYTSECTEYFFKVTSKAFGMLMIALGMPLGRKSEKKILVPDWIKDAPLWIKRNFLAGLFGADGSIAKIKGCTPLPLHYTITSNKSLESCLLEFVKDIIDLLKEFGIQAKYYKIKASKDKVCYRIYIEGDQNIYLFLTKIGYEYNKKKFEYGNYVAEYIRRKKIITKEREKIRQLIKNLKKNGKNLKEIYKLVDKNLVNLRFIERSMYENISNARIPKNFIKFDDFMKKYCLGGFVYDKIKDIRKIQSNYKYVYDIGVDHRCHNFIAENIVVHNCGVRLITTNLREEDVRPKLKILLDTIFRNVPSGVGSTGKLRLTESQLDEVLQYGVKWAIENGYGVEEDLERIEERGQMKDANPNKVSHKAKKRGRPQLGTLGAGNHFLEIQRVDKIYNEKVAKKFGILEEGQITIMIHTGSRGLGHQVASDYLALMMSKLRDIVKRLPDRELIYAPITSDIGRDYWQAMCAAANYAWTNRQLITHWTRESFEMVFKKDWEELGLHIVYDVAHNIAKKEFHKVNGEKKWVYVHRKGATRAFPPGHEELPRIYRDVGQPIIIPGSMGTASYVLVGTEKAMEITFGSTAHGAGRQMSRARAVRLHRGQEVARNLERRGILVRAASWRVVAEEAPDAYKDIDEVARVSDAVGIGKLVARLVPIGVVKG